MNNLQFLNWVYDRLKYVHKENPNVDYMIKLRLIVDEYPQADKLKEENMTLKQELHQAREANMKSLKIHAEESQKLLAELQDYRHPHHFEIGKPCPGCGVELDGYNPPDTRELWPECMNPKCRFYGRK